MVSVLGNICHQATGANLSANSHSDPLRIRGYKVLGSQKNQLMGFHEQLLLIVFFGFIVICSYVCWYRGTPSHHPFIDGISLLNQPFWGTPNNGKPWKTPYVCWCSTKLKSQYPNFSWEPFACAASMWRHLYYIYDDPKSRDIHCASLRLPMGFVFVVPIWNPVMDMA